MSDDSRIPDRVRDLRRRRGMSQEELADAAGCSVQVVRKIEQGGTARMETYNALGRALGVRTVWFATSGPPDPQPSTHQDTQLAEIRAAVNPAFSMDGTVGGVGDDPPDLAMLGRAAAALAAAYKSDRYDDVARLSPAIIHSANLHVAQLDGSESEAAHRLRSDILGVAGRYLIQVREHDLALIALRDSLQDALQVDDQSLAAAAISSQARALMRQGRFSEVEEVCAASADRVEPHISKATPDELSAWGWLLVRASTAAARNNRPEEAREYLGYAKSAAAPLSEEVPNTVGHRAWGPLTVATKGPENELVGGAPEQALRLAEDMPRGVGKTMRSNWHRHHLDKAKAHAILGDVERSTEILTRLRKKAPEWLRYQQSAREIAEDILEGRERVPSEEQRALADFLGVPM